MTKADLEGIRNLKYEIKNIKEKLRELKFRSLVASPLPGETHGSGLTDKVASITQRKLELEQELSEKHRQLRERLGFIAAISDYVLREIVYCHCVYKFTWQEIAEKVGGNNDSDSVRKLYDRFMNKL